MSRLAPLLLVACWSAAACAHAEPPAPLEDEAAKLGYSVGYRVGSDFRDRPTTLDPDLVVEGVMDALRGTQPRMTGEEMREALIGLQERTPPPEPAPEPP